MNKSEKILFTLSNAYFNNKISKNVLDEFEKEYNKIRGLPTKERMSGEYKIERMYKSINNAPEILTDEEIDSILSNKKNKIKHYIKDIIILIDADGKYSNKLKRKYNEIKNKYSKDEYLTIVFSKELEKLLNNTMKENKINSLDDVRKETEKKDRVIIEKQVNKIINIIKYLREIKTITPAKYRKFEEIITNAISSGNLYTDETIDKLLYAYNNINLPDLDFMMNNFEDIKSGKKEIINSYSNEGEKEKLDRTYIDIIEQVLDTKIKETNDNSVDDVLKLIDEKDNGDKSYKKLRDIVKGFPKVYGKGLSIK